MHGHDYKERKAKVLQALNKAKNSEDAALEVLADVLLEFVNISQQLQATATAVVSMSHALNSMRSNYADFLKSQDIKKHATIDK